MYKTPTVKTLDIGGSFTALLCVIHCLLLQAALILAPWLASKWWLADTHIWMLLPAWAFTGYALFRGCRTHRQFFIPLLGCAGLILMGVAVTLSSVNWELMVTLFGSTLVLSAHYYNWKNHSRCEKC